MSNSSFWQRIGLHEWFLKKDEPPVQAANQITPEKIYNYLVEQFHHSIGQLSFANRVVFFHEYIICFNPEDYQDFIDNKKGIFGIIAQESVKQFYAILKQYRQQGKSVEPSSGKWVFRFVSHPDYNRGDISFIGKLLPGAQQQEENLRITFIPRQTGIAQTADISADILRGFNFYSEGYYEIPFMQDLEHDLSAKAATSHLARLEAIIPEREYAGKKIEFLMRSNEIAVSGKEDPSTDAGVFKVPTEWINSPHLKIRMESGKLFLAAFGEKTVLNEKEIRRSDPAMPEWVELPYNSRLVLNGIVGINIYKS